MTHPQSEVGETKGIPEVARLRDAVLGLLLEHAVIVDRDGDMSCRCGEWNGYMSGTHPAHMADAVTPHLHAALEAAIRVTYNTAFSPNEATRRGLQSCAARLLFARSRDTSVTEPNS